MFNWYKKVVFENFSNFNGRARRLEYWSFVLFNIIFVVFGIFLEIVIEIIFELPLDGLSLLYLFAVLLPGLAVGVRRLHDINKSGWYILLPLIPLIGSIWLLVLFSIEGTPGVNSYGENPKQNI